MSEQTRSTNPTSKLILSGLALFLLLCGFYLLTYRGFALSKDETFIFDSTESLVNHGIYARTYEFSRFNDADFTAAPWGNAEQEPMISWTLAPFVWVGQRLSQIGTMHFVWTFNIFVTALTGVSIYAGTLLLRYPLRTAWLAGLAFGLGTVAWVYARYLFREPLMALFTVWAVVFALMIRQSWREQPERLPWRAGILLVLAFVAAFLTKAVSILLLPGLLLIILPPFDTPQQRRRLFTAIGGLMLLLVAVMAFIVITDSGRDRYNLSYWRDEFGLIEFGFLWESFLGYQFSLSRSLWLHSPVLLLGLGGAWMLFRQRDWRLLLGVTVILAGMSASYGIAHDLSWWGSWGWGPRYMLPLTPLILLAWVLPLLDKIQFKPAESLFWSLLVFGAGLQLLGMSVRLSNYYTDLNRSGVLVDWEAQPRWAPYNWSWEWSPIKYHFDRFEWQFLDVAWLSANPGFVGPLAALVIAAGSIGLSVWVVRQHFTPRITVYTASAVLIIALVGGIGAGLYTLREDERYIQEWPDVYTLATELDTHIHADDVVLIDREQYLPIFMNSFKVPSLTANLPYAPGENYGDGPEVVSADPVEQVGPLTQYTIVWTAERHANTWLIASSSPFEADKIRPIERLLVDYYFPVQEVKTSDRARAIQYYNVLAPQGDPAHNTEVVFNDSLALRGYDLPMGAAYAPGEVVPVSLQWSPVAPLPDDYNVSVQIAAADGFLVAQRDGQPQGTFGYMSRWEVGQPYRDNHGLQLPADLPPGEYWLQVIVYRWQDGERLLHSGGDVAQLTLITVQ